MLEPDFVQILAHCVFQFDTPAVDLKQRAKYAVFYSVFHLSKASPLESQLDKDHF